MNVRNTIGEGLKKRLYLRYLGISVIPFIFFVLLGAAGISLSQRYVSEELSTLSFRNLSQVRETFELILNETDSIALSLATEPGFNQAARYLLEHGIQSLEDATLYRTFMDRLLLATNVRRYLYSLYVYNRYIPVKLITQESIVEISNFYDTEWLSHLESKKEELRFWLQRREILNVDNDSLFCSFTPRVRNNTVLYSPKLPERRVHL